MSGFITRLEHEDESETELRPLNSMATVEPCLRLPLIPCNKFECRIYVTTVVRLQCESAIRERFMLKG